MHISLERNNLSDIILSKNTPQKEQSIAVLFNGEQFTYGKLSSLTASYAEFLSKQGVAKGHNVLLAFPDSIGFCAAFFGILALGAIVVPISPKTSQQSIQHIAEQAQCTFAIIDARLEDVHFPCQTFELDPCSISPFGTENQNLSFTPVECDLEQVAYILFSSGSTGIPKGIPHLHNDLIYAAESYADTVIKYTNTDTVLCVPKLFFGYALGCNLIFPLLKGAAIILLEGEPTQEALLNAAEHYQPTIFIGQPRNLTGLMASNNKDPLRKIRISVVAGEKLNKIILERWRYIFPDVPLLDGYGTTEANTIFISNTPENFRLGSVGKPMPGYSVDIRSLEGEENLVDGVGELWFKGKSVCKCYWDAPKTSADKIKDGWVRTGDLFYRDDEGFYYVRGRIDDMLKVGCGAWVNPTHIENEIHKVSQVEECAVTGYTDDEGVIQIKALVLLKENFRPTRTIHNAIIDIVHDAFANLNSHHLKQIEFVSELPKTSTGKLDRKQLSSFTQLEFSYQC